MKILKVTRKGQGAAKLMMNKLLTLAATGCIAFSTVHASANIISEFQPNPVGGDPDPQDVELVGTPLASYSGFISTIEMDGAGGTIDRQTAVSGTYDANGFAVESVADLENPGFTLVFSSADGGGIGADLDTDNDGVLEDPSVFGTVFDAISIPDDSTDSGYYGGQLGGADFVFSGDEPKLAFRDGTTGDWYAVNDQGNVPEEVRDINGNLKPNAGFDMDPEVTTFGSTNPSFIPEPASGFSALLGLIGLTFLRRK